MTRQVVVTLAPALHPSRVVGIFHAIQLLPGVVSVADLEAISRDTLDALLLQPEAPVVPERIRQLELTA